MEIPRVLVVEDDAFLRSLMIRKLTEDGFAPIFASSGEEGLKKVIDEKEKVDIILLDLILPGIDGYEVLRKLKENQESAKIPVIILSNLGQKSEISKGMELGAAGFMIKAYFTPDEIVSRIKEILGKK